MDVNGQNPTPPAPLPEAERGEEDGGGKPRRSPLTFRKHEHLRSRNDFERVYARRATASDGVVLVFADHNGLPHSRVGFSVSRKYGGAVQRNRLRRLYREAFRLTKHELPPGLDLILIPRGPAEPTLADLQASLRKLVPQAARRLARAGGPKP